MHRSPFPGEGLSVAELRELQAAVDEGHQPWRTDASAVAEVFAGVRFGWSAPRAVPLDPHTVEVTDPRTGSTVVFRLRQPVRTGATGIWTVTAGVWTR